MIKKVTDISQNTDGNLTEHEMQVVVACKWLVRGFNSFLGGEKLAHWLDQHLEGVEQIFGADDRIYILLKTKELNAELAQFIVQEQIGDEVQWKKFKDSNRWWLYIWWGE